MSVADPPEDLQQPTLAQLLKDVMEWRLQDLHTCSWGYITSYDATSQTCGVQLIPRRTFTDEDGQTQTERPAPLVSVPVIFPGSGDYSITWPLKGGDPVLVVFGERAMHQWRAGGAQDVDLDDERMHSLSDAIAIPGLRAATGPIGGPPPDDALVVTTPSGKKIYLGDKNAKRRVATNDDIALLVQAIKATLSIPDIVFSAAITTAQGTLTGLDDSTHYTPGLTQTTPPFPDGSADVKAR